MRPGAPVALTVAGTLAATAAAPAAGDTLVAPAPGARNLAAGGGWMAWAAPDGAGRWRLTVRSPDGTVSTPRIPSFAQPPDASIGREGVGSRGLLAVYARCAGSSAVRGCDIFSYDLVAGVERRVSALSSPKTSELAPSLSLGAWGFVRRDGARPGVYAFTPRGGVRRLSPIVATETAANGSRVVFTYRSSTGGGVASRAFSGQRGTLVLTSGRPTVPRSIVLTRYKAGWLEPAAGGGGQEVHWSSRMSGRRMLGLPIRVGRPALPPSTDSIAAGALRGAGTAFRSEPSRVTDYLDAEGVKHIVPELKF